MKFILLTAALPTLTEAVSPTENFILSRRNSEGVVVNEVSFNIADGVALESIADFPARLAIALNEMRFGTETIVAQYVVTTGATVQLLFDAEDFAAEDTYTFTSDGTSAQHMGKTAFYASEIELPDEKPTAAGVHSGTVIAAGLIGGLVGHAIS
jgi:hypothetical protein